MLRRTSAVGMAALMLAASLSAVGANERPSIGVPEPLAPHVPGEILVRFAPGADRSARAAAMARVGGRLIRHLRSVRFNLIRVGVPVDDALGMLSRSPAVEVAEPNYTGTLALAPNDPCVPGCGGGVQWNVGAVNAPGGWAVVPGRFYTSTQKKSLDPIKVAVLDTRIDRTQGDWINAAPLPVNRPYASANGGQLDLENAVDIVPPGRQGGSASYHGTFIAGILGAATNNAAGVAGLAYHASLIPITVVDGDGVVSAADLTDGITHARLAGARVINLSLGLRQTSTAVQDAVDIATAAGALVVAAAGNDGNSQPFYPAGHHNAMAVAALDHADRPGPCSNFGSQISVAAPGMGILSMDPRASSGYSVAGCGTSTAAPHVSALAALLFAQDPTRTPHQVRAIIERTADDDRFFPGRDDRFGHGRVNFERALRDGDGPTVDRVITTVPRALGGSSTFTATATAASTSPIRGAEWFVGSLGAEGTGGQVHPADGSFGGTQEELTVDVNIPLGFPTGVHRILIRARDDQGWGPASVGVLIVDRTPPTISSFEASPAAAVTIGQPVELTFEATDDYAASLTYSYTVTDELNGQVVHVSEPAVMSRSETTTWLPDPVVRGTHRIDLTVRDDAGNPARATTRSILL